MDERHRVLIADSYPDEAEQLKKELSGKYNVISVRDNGVDTLDDIIKLKPDLVVIDLMLSETVSYTHLKSFVRFLEHGICMNFRKRSNVDIFLVNTNMRILGIPC